MAIKVNKTYTAQSNGAATSLTIRYASDDLSIGDTLLAFIGKDDDTATTAQPTGWTLVQGGESNNAIYNEIWKKEVASGDIPSVTAYDLGAGHSAFHSSKINLIGTGGAWRGHIGWNSTGTKFIGCDGSDELLYECTCSTAWDVSTASVTDTLDISASTGGNIGSIAVNADGTQVVFVVGGTTSNTGYYYNLSTGYDLSTAGTVQSFTLNSSSNYLACMFGDSDNKFYAQAINDIQQYSLSTTGDVSSLSYTQAHSMGVSSNSFLFNSTGTKLYFSYSLSNSESFRVYDLSTGWDVSTIGSTWVPFKAENAEDSPHSQWLLGAGWADSGERLTVTTSTNRTIIQNDVLGYQDETWSGDSEQYVGAIVHVTGGDYTTITASTALTGSATPPDSPTPTLVADTSYLVLSGFSIDGDSTPLALDTDLTEIANLTETGSGGVGLALGYNDASSDRNKFQISWSFTEDNIDNSTFEILNTIVAVHWSDDGTDVLVEHNTGEIYHYTCSTAFDLTTKSYVTGEWDDIAANVSNHDEHLRFNVAGTKAIGVVYTTDTITFKEYTLSTAFDPSTATLTDTSTGISITNGGSHRCLWCDRTGKNFYWSNSIGYMVWFEFTTPWDISAGITKKNETDWNTNHSHYPQEGAITPDGSMIISGNGTNLYRTTLSTSFDPSTGTSLDSIADGVTTPFSLDFSPDGVWRYRYDGYAPNTEMEQVEASGTYHPPLTTHTVGSNDEWYGFTVTIEQGAANITQTADSLTLTTFDPGIIAPINIHVIPPTGIESSTVTDWGDPFGADNPYGHWWKPDGTRIYIISGGDDLIEYTVSPAWDLSGTVTDTGNRKDLSGVSTSLRVLQFNPAGTKVYANDISGNEIIEWNLATAWDLSSALTLSGSTIDYGTDAGANGNLGFCFGDSGKVVSLITYSGSNPYTHYALTYTLATAYDFSSTQTKVEDNAGISGLAGVSLYSGYNEFNSDGTIAWVTESAATGLDGIVVEFALSTPWRLGTGTRGNNFDVTDGGSTPSGTHIDLSYQNENLWITYTGSIDEIVIGAALNLTAFDASVSTQSSTDVTQVAASLTIAASAATVQADVDTNVTATAGTLTLASANQAVNDEVNANQVADSLAITAFDVSVVLATEVAQQNVGAYTLTPFDVSVQADVDTNVYQDNTLDEVVVNGGFDADTNWIKGTGWTISGNTANVDATSTTNLQQSNILTISAQYKVVYTISNYTDGTITVYLGATAGTPRTGNGTYTEYLTATVSDDLFIEASNNATLSVDNVSCAEYLPYPAFTTFDAGVNWAKNITTTASALTVTGFDATIATDVTINQVAATLTLAGADASVQADVDSNITATAGTLSLAPVSQGINASKNITTIAGALNLLPFDAGVQADTNTNITATSQALTVAPVKQFIGALCPRVDSAGNVRVDSAGNRRVAVCVDTAGSVTQLPASLALTAYAVTVQANIDTPVTATAASLALAKSDQAIQANVDTNVATTADSLAITAVNQAVTAAKNITQVAGALNLVASAQGVQANVDTNITATSEALNLTASDTTVQADVDTPVTATSQALNLVPGTQGVQADVDANITATAGALTLATLPQVVTAGENIDVTQQPASLAITTFDASIQADVDVNITQVASALTLAPATQGVQADVDIAITQAPATLALTASDVLVHDDKTITTTAETLTVTAFDADVQFDLIIFPAPASLAIASQAQGVQANVDTDVTATTASLALAKADQAIQADVDVNVAQAADSVALTGFNSTVQANVNLFVTQIPASLDIAGHQQSVQAGQNVIVPQLPVALDIAPATQGIQANVNLFITQVPATLTLGAISQAVTAGVDLVINQTPVARTLTSFDVTVQADVDTNVVAGTASLALVSYDAALYLEEDIPVTPASLTLATFDQVVQADTDTTVIQVPGALTVTPENQAISAHVDATIVQLADYLTITPFDTMVGAPTNVYPPAVVLNFTVYAQAAGVITLPGQRTCAPGEDNRGINVENDRQTITVTADSRVMKA